MTDASSKPRLLVVAGEVPYPLDHGGRLRLYHFLVSLVRRWRITLVVPGSLDRASDLPAGIRCVSTHDATRFAPGEPAPSRGYPLFPANPIWGLAARHFRWDQGLAAWLVGHAHRGHFDAALLAGTRFGLHGPQIRVPTVWDAVDELVLQVIRRARLAAPQSWPRMLRTIALYAAFERAAIREVRGAVFTSIVDASYARRWSGGGVDVISNGVDLRYFAPRESLSNAHDVLFVGGLSFGPNVEGIAHFARRIWPQLHRADSRRRLRIVGRDPSPAVRALAAIAGVELVGPVPDVRPYLASAGCVIVPTRTGGGVKNKILEAAAAARPIVATPQAIGGLSVRAGEHLLIASTPCAWVRRIEYLLCDASRGMALGRAAHRWVRENHDWDRMGARLDQLLVTARQLRVGTGANAITMGRGSAADARGERPKPGILKHLRDSDRNRTSEFMPVLPGADES